MIATCRLQLHGQFTFDDAIRVVPYLAQLGVSHLYLSPILRSRSGSTHGYDVVDPTRVDPELGGEEGWRRLITAARAHGLGLVLDIVPNHMGVGAENPYWEDVFANGPASRYANWFDIDWDTPQRGLAGRIMVPVLGDTLDRVLDRGEITLAFEDGRFRIRYFDHRFPVDPATIPALLDLDHQTEESGDETDPDLVGLRQALDRYRALPSRTMRRAGAKAKRQEGISLARREIAELAGRSDRVRRLIQDRITTFSTGPGSAERLRRFLDRQVYALSYWRRAGHEINYRRFFDINELVGLRVDDPDVFARTHARVLEWVADGSLHGLRIDHVDGLRDPAGYLERLRMAVEQRLPGEPGRTFPILVEKILAPNERLRETWPVQGTTGYECLNDIEAVLVDPAGLATITAGYLEFVNRNDLRAGFHQLSIRSKLEILRTSLKSDVYRLGRLLGPVMRALLARPLKRDELTEAVEQCIARLPVYRTYLRAGEPVHPDDAAMLDATLHAVRAQSRIAEDLLERLGEILQRGVPSGDEPLARNRRRFIERWQQATGPAAAKGVEDTALYRYLPLCSLNEVGADPGRPLGDAVERLHRANAARAARWPAAMVTVETHDTKRSADLRSRISVLSEVPEEWLRRVRRWHAANRRHRVRTPHGYAPDRNTEWLIYQTLAGLWPTEPGPDPATVEALRERMSAYVLKAMREAKVRSSWTDPDEPFEQGTLDFVRAVLADPGFQRELTELAGVVGPVGCWNALTRLTLHLMVPGVPDLYQGGEWWNYSLVDPDNRRPVDFTAREETLLALERDGPDPATLVTDPGRDALKQWLLSRLLRIRRDYPGVFASGAYIPVAAVGERNRQVLAFLRSDDETVLIVVSRLNYLPGHAPRLGEAWGDTRLTPDLEAGRWRSLLDGEEIAPGLRCSDLLRRLPVNVCRLMRQDGPGSAGRRAGETSRARARPDRV